MDEHRRPVIYISRKRRRSYILLVTALLASLALGIACLVDEDWYTQGSHDSKWRGSLLRVTSGTGVKEGSYSSIHHHYCGSDESGQHQGLCNEFRDLALLGKDVIGFTSATLATGLLQLLFVVLGWKRNHQTFLRVTRVIFGCARIGYGLAAPIEIFTKGHVTLDGNCKHLPDSSDRKDLCAGSGVYLLFIAYCSAVLTTVLIHIVFLNDIRLIRRLRTMREEDQRHQFITGTENQYSSYHFAEPRQEPSSANSSG